jgi:LmbE family N-acetylglucosaminyl deacetylase
MRDAVVIAVSAHLDDAALSAGALIADLGTRGARIEVHTVFAGHPDGDLSNVARAFHDTCGLGEDAIAVRRDEDVAAMSELGAQARHWDFDDAVYRRRDDRRWLCQHDRAMFDPDLPDEPALSDAIRRAIDAVCARTEPSLLLTTSGDGDHVDHRITRDTVLAIAEARALPVLLWEDLPYAVGRPATRTATQPFAHVAPPDAWRRKWRAIAAYASQVRMLWPNCGQWQALLGDHALARGEGHPAELFWTA